ncbi:MAG: DNRLRE domain-containing protein [Candidatus Thorarchaeota archaeon]
MKKSRSAFAGFLIALFSMTMFTPTVLVSTESSTSSMLVREESTTAIDGDNGVLTIPVWKNEYVLNGSPDLNHNGITNFGGLLVGLDGTADLARSFVAFDLSHLPSDTAFLSARLYAFMSGELPMTTNDTAIGVYYCDDDLWDETLITWNNQPTSSVSPSDVIDSPASPDMFILNHWYSWDVTSDVRTAFAGDKLLTELIRNVDENAEPGTGKGFAKTEYYQFNATYLELSYTTPTVTEFAVDGHSSGPLLDYIQDSTPLMSWNHVDPDPNDVQYGYEVEVWNDPLYNETRLWSDSSTFIQPVFYANLSQNAPPFETDSEMRFQYKYDSSILNRSGTVDKLHFYVVEDEGVLTLENVIVRMASTQTSGALGSDFEGNYWSATPITVLRSEAYEAVVHNSILTIDVENVFVLNHRLSLIIEIRFTGLDGSFSVSELDASSSVGWVAYEYGQAGDYTATTAGYLYPRCHSLDIELVSEEIYTSETPIGNSFPFDTTVGYPGRFVWKYNNSLISKTGYVDKLFFNVFTGGTDVQFEDFEVYICETPVLGRLQNGTWTYNYGGVTPTLVLSEANYTVRNLGSVMVVDVDNIFYFKNEMDLLVEFRWGSLISGNAICLFTYEGGSEGGYHAWDLNSGGFDSVGNGTLTYDMSIDFIRPESDVEYAGLPLVDATRYYSRVRTCDITGIWTSWKELSFKYEVLTSVPDFDGPLVTPSPVPLGEEVEVASNVTYFLGVNQVLIEYDGSNHTMTSLGDRYSHSWTPDVPGIMNFTIFMESGVGTWSSVTGSFEVVAGLSVDPMLLALIGGGIIVVLVIVFVLSKKRSGKK